MDSPATPGSKVEFLISGSPNDAFYSQIAFFRLSLDHCGDEWRNSRLVAVFGDDEVAPLPPRWEPHFERIEVHHADPEAYRRDGYHAASDLRFRLVDPRADLSCLCDADTALISPLPADMIDETRRRPAILGVPAHFPLRIGAGAEAAFPIASDAPGRPRVQRLPAGMSDGATWDAISQAVLGRPVERLLRYSLLAPSAEERCPFYVNYGFVAAPPGLLSELESGLRELHGHVAALVGSGFYGQVAITMAVEKHDLPWRALPLRFNYPNDRKAEELHPDELAEVILMHYLRTGRFDRHRIFASKMAFDEFLSRVLAGSDRVFQDHVWQVTGGQYPFPEPGQGSATSNPPARKVVRPRDRRGVDWVDLYASYPLAFGRSEYLKQAGHTVKGEAISEEQSRLVLKDMETLLGMKQDDVLLDLCCGNGVFTKELARKCERVIGVDFSVPLLEVAEGDHFANNITYHQMDALEVGSTEFMGSIGFDKVVMCAALQHFTPGQFEGLLKDLIDLTPKERVFVFTMVPDRRRKWDFYDTLHRRSQHLARVFTRRERMGTWWHPHTVEEICSRLGLSCSFHPVDEGLEPSWFRFNIRIE